MDLLQRERGCTRAALSEIAIDALTPLEHHSNLARVPSDTHPRSLHRSREGLLDWPAWVLGAGSSGSSWLLRAWLPGAKPDDASCRPKTDGSGSAEASGENFSKASLAFLLIVNAIETPYNSVIAAPAPRRTQHAAQHPAAARRPAQRLGALAAPALKPSHQGQHQRQKGAQTGPHNSTQPRVTPRPNHQDLLHTASSVVPYAVAPRRSARPARAAPPGRAARRG